MVVSSITATLSILWRRGFLQSLGREGGLEISPSTKSFSAAPRSRRAPRDRAERLA